MNNGYRLCDLGMDAEVWVRKQALKITRRTKKCSDW